MPAAAAAQRSLPAAQRSVAQPRRGCAAAHQPPQQVCLAGAVAPSSSSCSSIASSSLTSWRPAGLGASQSRGARQLRVRSFAPQADLSAVQDAPTSSGRHNGAASSGLNSSEVGAEHADSLIVSASVQSGMRRVCACPSTQHALLPAGAHSSGPLSTRHRLPACRSRPSAGPPPWAATRCLCAAASAGGSPCRCTARRRAATLCAHWRCPRAPPILSIWWTATGSAHPASRWWPTARGTTTTGARGGGARCVPAILPLPAAPEPLVHGAPLLSFPCVPPLHLLTPFPTACLPACLPLAPALPCAG